MNALDLSKDDRLKPCPHCGGEAELGETVGFYYVSCINACDGYSSEKDRAVAIWNRRHEETPSEFDRLCGKEPRHV